MNTPQSIPYNVEAEEAVIGCLMADVQTVRKLPFLSPESFFVQRHQVLFQLLEGFYNKGIPCEPLILATELDRINKLEFIGGTEGIKYFYGGVPNLAHVEHYGQIVERTHTLRGIIYAAQKAAKLAYEDTDRELADICGEVENIMTRATRTTSQTVSTTVGEGAAVVSERLYKILFGAMPAAMPMPLPLLDRYIGGWVECEQTVMAAKTGKGKTHFGVFSDVDLARRGHPCAYYSLEMFIDAISIRFVSCIGQIDNQQLRFGFRPKLDLMTDPLTGERMYPYRLESPDALWRANKRAEEELMDLPIIIIAPKRDTTGRVVMPDFTPHGIRASVFDLAEKHGIKKWTLDNLQRVDLPAYKDAAKRSNDLGEVSMMLRNATIATGTHMLCMVQPKKGIQGDMTHEDLSDSKKIADNTDNAFTIDTVQGDKKGRVFRFSKYRNGEDLEIANITMEGAIGWFSDSESRRLIEQATSARTIPRVYNPAPVEEYHPDDYDMDF